MHPWGNHEAVLVEQRPAFRAFLNTPLVTVRPDLTSEARCPCLPCPSVALCAWAPAEGGSGELPKTEAEVEESSELPKMEAEAEGQEEGAQGSAAASSSSSSSTTSSSFSSSSSSSGSSNLESLSMTTQELEAKLRKALGSAPEGLPFDADALAEVAATRKGKQGSKLIVVVAASHEHCDLLLNCVRSLKKVGLGSSILVAAFDKATLKVCSPTSRHSAALPPFMRGWPQPLPKPCHSAWGMGPSLARAAAA